MRELINKTDGSKFRRRLCRRIRHCIGRKCIESWNRCPYMPDSSPDTLYTSDITICSNCSILRLINSYTYTTKNSQNIWFISLVLRLVYFPADLEVFFYLGYVKKTYIQYNVIR